jgi:hypothetical protein
VTFDRDSQAVEIVKPDGFYRPRRPVGEDHGLTDKLRIRLLERVKDRQRTAPYSGDVGPASHCKVAEFR